MRQEFSDFLERRDGFKSDIEKIFLCNGASEAVRLVLRYVHRTPLLRFSWRWHMMWEGAWAVSRPCRLLDFVQQA